MKFRSDIEGLRAIAIVPVVLFHAGIPSLSGGFVGVDVFFVITGYLMTRIILPQMLDGRFRLIEFLSGRLCRVVPALFVMSIGVMACALVVSPPRMLTDVSFVLAGLGLSMSNVALWRKSANYFDTPTEWNPLLHTWSLSLEGQFYLLLPVFLLTLWKLRPPSIQSVLVGAAVASLLLSVWGCFNAPTATFYLLPMRLWEFLVGALVAMPVIHRLAHGVAEKSRLWVSTALGCAGIASISWGVFSLTPESVFPGLAAVPACLGAAALILAGEIGQGWPTRILQLSPFLWTGRVSYSLYLWHWPIFVFLEKYQLQQIPAAVRLPLALTLSLIAALLSWRLVEQPFRGTSDSRGKFRAFATPVAALAVLAVFGASLVRKDGLPGRYDAYAQFAMQRETVVPPKSADVPDLEASKCEVSANTSWHPEDCRLTRVGGRKALLWGGSFAASYVTGLYEINPDSWTIYDHTVPACPPIVGYDAASEPACRSINENAYARVANREFEVVILAANWLSYVRRRKLSVEDIALTIDRLRSHGVAVVLIGQSPVFQFAYPDEYALTRMDARSKPEELSAIVDVDLRFNATMNKATKADLFFDPFPTLCVADRCVFREGGLYIFRDFGHFTIYGSRRMSGALLKEMNRLR